MTGNNVSFDEALAATVKVRPCAILRALEALSPEDRAMAERALDNPKISGRRISEALVALLGSSAPGPGAVESHRRGDHQSCRPSTTP
jgi:hypothetical protein